MIAPRQPKESARTISSDAIRMHRKQPFGRLSCCDGDHADRPHLYQGKVRRNETISPASVDA